MTEVDQIRPPTPLDYANDVLRYYATYVDGHPEVQQVYQTGAYLLSDYTIAVAIHAFQDSTGPLTGEEVHKLVESRLAPTLPDFSQHGTTYVEAAIAMLEAINAVKEGKLTPKGERMIEEAREFARTYPLQTQAEK